VIELFPAGTTIDADGTLVVGGCRLDDVAREHGTPVMVVAEDAVRQRARAYRTGWPSAGPRSQVAFASKAFACTAVQRLMVSEGLWLDVAGGGEIVTGARRRRRPGDARAARQRQDHRGDRARGRCGSAPSSVDNLDDVDRLAPPCRRAGCRAAWCG
jgi:diaminopimelate decarboxylase